MQTEPITSIGFFGGAFDPPHRGHRAILAQAAAQTKISHWLIMPTGCSAHQKSFDAQGQHRLKMCELGFADLGLTIEVSDWEMKQKSPSYTIDTIRALMPRYPLAAWALLIGQDQWVHFATWKEALALSRLCQVIVAHRAGVLPSESSLFEKVQWLSLEQEYPQNSTTIRHEIQNRDTPYAHWLEPDVHAYIVQHHLYLSST